MPVTPIIQPTTSQMDTADATSYYKPSTPVAVSSPSEETGSTSTLGIPVPGKYQGGRPMTQAENDKAIDLSDFGSDYPKDYKSGLANSGVDTSKVDD